MKKRNLSDVNEIILHCSDSAFGDERLIYDWHVNGNGWDNTGYHYVILNGIQAASETYKPFLDGQITPARPLDIVGAHCKGYNIHSIGICLIGTGGVFSRAQIFSLIELIDGLNKYLDKDLKISNHYQYTSQKSCPGMNLVEKVEEVRKFKKLKPITPNASSAVSDLEMRLNAMDSIIEEYVHKKHDNHEKRLQKIESRIKGFE